MKQKFILFFYIISYVKKTLFSKNYKYARRMSALASEKHFCSRKLAVSAGRLV